MHQQSRRSRHRVLIAAILATAAPSVAATVDWVPTAPSPGLFSDPANWSTRSAPTSTDAARFATGSAHTVALTADATTNQLVVGDDDLALDLAGHSYTLASLSSANPGVSLGSATTSSLTLRNTTPRPPPRSPPFNSSPPPIPAIRPRLR